MAEQSSAGTGADAEVMRENLYESLPPEEQARFLEVLRLALERGASKDTAWEEAWLAVQEAEGREHGDEKADFALEDEEA